MRFADALSKLLADDCSAIRRPSWRYNVLSIRDGKLVYLRGAEISEREGSDSLSLESILADDWVAVAPAIRTIEGYANVGDVISGQPFLVYPNAGSGRKALKVSLY